MPRPANYHREQKLKRRYGLTQADYDTMLEQQGGGCKICGRLDRPLVVDHCHVGGQVRGIVCKPCNLGLGLVKDNPNLLRRMIGYLNESERHTSQTG